VKRVLFVDLDDTLFQSRRKCPEGSELLPTAFLADGSAHSFMTARQQRLWGWLGGRDAVIIPTTARNRESFSRVRLAFSSWRILDYGGVILDAEGQPDPDWMARMRTQVAPGIDALQALLERAQAWIDERNLAVRLRLIEDCGLPLYLVAKYRDERVAHLNLLQRELIEPWVAAQDGTQRLHRNDNNLAVLPQYLDKAFAVRHLIERLSADWGEILTIGIGDSLIDAPFMAECDYAITPRGTQLHAATLGMR
jgi:hypothetical protein